MTPVAAQLIMFGVQELISQAPALIADFQQLFGKGTVPTDEEWNAYVNLRNELRANQNIHQMFGHADDVQPYALENSYGSTRDVFFPDGRPFRGLTPKEQNEEFFQGRLLLQVDEEKDSGMQFGRGGRLFFFIREQDLKTRDFSKVWVNEQ